MTIPSQDLKQCRICGKDSTQIGFAPYEKTRCKDCTQIYHAEYRVKNREAINTRIRNWNKKGRMARNAKSVLIRRKKIANMSESELREFRKFETDKTKRLAKVLKAEVFEAYGGFICNCCGETIMDFLSIDHVNEDGAELRRSNKHGRGSTEMYRWLKKNNYPEGFQVLCMNCNVGKHRNNGVCPHQVRCNDYPVKGVPSSEGKRTTPQVGDDIV